MKSISVVIAFFIVLCGFSQENIDEIPNLSLKVTSNCSNFNIKLQIGDSIILDTLVADSNFNSTNYKYGFDYLLTFSKKKYTTKSVLILAKYFDKVAEDHTVLGMSPNFIPQKQYKSKSAFKTPVALIKPDENGELNYDFEYINERSKIIESYKKKKYK